MSTWEYLEGRQPIGLNRATSWFGLLKFEKTVFVVVNLMDIVMTYVLLHTGFFYESNPIAAFVMDGWGFMGMTVFKLSVVSSVLMIANIIAFSRITTARSLLYVGSTMVAGVVGYSVMLLMDFYGML